MDPNGFLWMGFHRLQHLRQLRLVISFVCALSGRDILILRFVCVRTGQYTGLGHLCNQRNLCR